MIAFEIESLASTAPETAREPWTGTLCYDGLPLSARSTLENDRSEPLVPLSASPQLERTFDRATEHYSELLTRLAD